jgi:ABC-2 type transport system permease protein
MSQWRDTMVIARRELDERIRSKWFVVMTLLGPIFMVALVVIPALIATRGTSGARIEIIDHTKSIAPALVERLQLLDWKATIVPSETSQQHELDRIRDDEINGFLTIPDDALDGGRILYLGDNASSQTVQTVLQLFVTEVVQKQRAIRFSLTDEQATGMLARVNVVAEHSTGEAKGSSGLGAFFIAYILAFILYMVITLYGVAVMRSVVQEKTSRVMEFLVAAVKPRALMAGKILGVGGAALIQITVWLGIGALALAYRTELLAMFGVDGGGASLPPLALAEISVVLIYFILGFFFYSAMYAAVGAMVSSEQDTQQVQMPVTMLLVIGVMCLQVISNDPRGSTSQAMTMIPLWSPMLMPMRFVLGGATLGEVAMSLGILLVSTILIVRAAAKIYRVGVLLYGKRPSVRELVRWLRY